MRTRADLNVVHRLTTGKSYRESGVAMTSAREESDHDECGAEAGRTCPSGLPDIAPWVISDDTAAFIDFARTVFGAHERFPPVYFDETETRIAHAELQIGDSVLMLFDRGEGWAPTPAFINAYVENCDDVHRRALTAGATEVTRLSTNAWGDRGSRIRDPFGNLWWIQTHVEDVSEEEIASRMEEQRHAAVLTESTDTLNREMRSRAT